MTTPTVERAPVARRPHFSLSDFARRNRLFVGALGFFIALLALFIALSPDVFLDKDAYFAVFVSLPLLIILVVPQVFVVTSGEIDLSFASVVGLTGFVFAHSVDSWGLDVWTSSLLAILTGAVCGVLSGALVAYFGLSSLVATLGLYFLLRGVVQVLSNGNGIPVSYLSDTNFRSLLVGKVGSVPAQMFWAALFVAIGMLLWHRHRFGSNICAVGDNEEAARAMGINVRRVKTAAFVYIAMSAGVVGIMSVLINSNFFPTLGDGLLLTVIAAVFVGGTPTFGGIGTVAGAVVGAFTVGFIETGIVAAGLTGFWTQFFYGLVIILSLIGLRYARRA